MTTVKLKLLKAKLLMSNFSAEIINFSAEIFIYKYF